MGGRPELPSGTVTFLFTDIEGSTGLLKQLGRDGYESVLAEHAGILRAAFAAHGGQVVDTQGDSFFAAFRAAREAVAAAVEAQRELAAAEWPEGVELRVRMGLHSGEPKASGERYVGIGVHRAARVGGVAHGGQVLLSDATRVLVEDDLPPRIYLKDLGSFRLKDIDRPERISQVAAEGLPSDFPPLRGAEPVKPPPVLRRRSVLGAALVGVIAAAVAVPVLTLSGGGSSSAEAAAGVAADSVGVLASRDGRLVAQGQVGTGPSSIATGEGGVWVANVDDGSVSRIDPNTNAVVQTIRVGSQPSGIAVGDGFVWVTNYADGTVSQIDPGTNAVVRTIRRVGSQPSGIAYGLGGVWVANSSDRTAVRIDPGSGKVGSPVSVSGGVDAITVGVGSVWVAGQSAGVVTRIDPGSGSEQTINVGRGPTALAVGSGSVWVTNSLDDTVSQIDPDSNRQSVVIPVGAGPSGIGTGRNLVWVTNEQGGTLSRIDPEQDKVVQTVETGNRPAGVALSGEAMYVTVRTSGLAHRGGTLRVVYGGGCCHAADHFDPAVAYDYGAWQQLMITNDGLVTYQRVGGSEGNRLVPDLAVSLPTPTDGGKTYTFQLRPGIRYSNGAFVRPADFRRAVERAVLARGGASGYYAGIVGAAGCQKAPKRCDLSKGIVVDAAAGTVTFHLTAPDPDFLYKLALPEADAEPTDTPLKAHLPLPATGPYRIASFREAGSFRLVRNPRFREWSAAAQPNGYPDVIRVDYDNSHTPEKSLRAVEQGNADLTGAERPATLRVRYGGQLHSTVVLATSAVFLNTRVPPFNDLRVRQAFNYAVDRNSLVTLTGGAGTARPTCQILPPNIAGYRPYCPYTIRRSASGRYIGPDLAEARRLVAASGTRGQSITIWTTGDRKLSTRDRYLRSVLPGLGYRAQVRWVPPKDFEDKYVNPRRKWQVVPLFGTAADYPAPSGLILPVLTCASFTQANNSNFSQFCRPRIDAEMRRAAALQTSDPQAAAKLWAKVDRDITDQAPWVPFANGVSTDLVSRRVGSYVSFPWIAGALLDQLWVK